VILATDRPKRPKRRIWINWEIRSDIIIGFFLITLRNSKINIGTINVARESTFGKRNYICASNITL